MNSRGSDAEVLWRTAQTLSRRAAAGKSCERLPALFFVTDPERTPDPARIARRLPMGCGIIHRGYGRPEAAKTAKVLAEVARARGLVLLIAADEALAAKVQADGVHLPERMVSRAPRLRSRRPNWLITGAAHSPRALTNAYRAGLDAVLLSLVFDSRSASATGRPLGLVRFAALVAQVRLPVYALGGLRSGTAKRLIGSGAAGLAAVDGLSGG